MKATIGLLLGTVAFATNIGTLSAAAHPHLSVSNAGAGGYIQQYIEKTPKGMMTLYDQNANDAGIAIISDYFSSGDFDSADSQAADDFTIPVGQEWSIKQVDVRGAYFNGSGPANSFNVFFYKNKKGLPGKLVKEFDNLPFADGFGAFAIRLPDKGIRLGERTFWVSVQANIDTDSGAGEWGWESSTVQNGNPAAWQNPGNAFGTGCTTWGVEVECLSELDGGPDLMFSLKGK